MVINGSYFCVVQEKYPHLTQAKPFHDLGLGGSPERQISKRIYKGQNEFLGRGGIPAAKEC